jgi:glycosyltransferase involved in cell wall biosynthesis
MEAMACGLPAVSTGLAGIPDIIVNGESGLLVEPEDAKGLADALERLARNEALARRLAEAGRKRMEEMFQIDRCLERLAGLFRERLTGRVHESEPAAVAIGASGEAA